MRSPRRLGKTICRGRSYALIHDFGNRLETDVCSHQINAPHVKTKQPLGEPIKTHDSGATAPPRQVARTLQKKTLTT